MDSASTQIVRDGLVLPNLDPVARLRGLEDAHLRLTLNLVTAFRRARRRDPKLSPAVLGTLPAHSASGAEAPLAAGIVLVAPVSVVVAVSAMLISG